MKLLNLLMALILLTTVTTGYGIGAPSDDSRTNNLVAVETGQAESTASGETADDEDSEDSEEEGDSDSEIDATNENGGELSPDSQITLLMTEVLKAFVKAFIGVAGADGAGLESPLLKALEDLLKSLETGGITTDEEPLPEDPAGVDDNVSSSRPGGSTTEIADYWTEERMKNAKPLPMGIPVPIDEGDKDPEVIEDKF